MYCGGAVVNGYIFHEDPGHGWLAVERAELKALAIENKITSYSYESGTTVYLEEDCDLSTFIDAWEREHKQKFSFGELVKKIHYRNDAPVRAMKSYAQSIGRVKDRHSNQTLKDKIYE